ncbi:sugar transferase [Butyrivibrio sp. MC2013]|uniref:sugar transferase n=1 Tax=Butyrivibrio sp. MC2013 TaxID=1280686 RepID=UPI0004038C09|nr:sugar transferase [Butyrivibrio sp. MC2013]
MNKTDNIRDDYKAVIRRLESLFEIGLLGLVFYLVWKYNYRLAFTAPMYGRGKYVLVGVYALLTFIIMELCDAFRFGYLKFSETFIASMVSEFLVNFITYFEISLISNVMVPVWPMLFMTLADFGISLILCYLYTYIYHLSYVPHNMLLIYGSDSALDIKFKMETRQDRYTVTEIIHYEEGRDKLIEAISRHDSVILNDIPAISRNNILKYCYSNEIRTYVVPKITDIIIKGAPDITLFDTPLMLVKGRGLSRDQKIAKRLLDIVLSLIAIIPFTVLGIIVAIAILIDDGGPVFFVQKRITEGGRSFKMYKFRSMKKDLSGDELTNRARQEDSRITRVGRLIRAMRLDEIPQIINIIKGEMSFVGPRAEHEDDYHKGLSEISEYGDRLKVKAGLTGYAQIYGKYNTLSYDKLRLDLIYIENYSILLDIKLIFMTLIIIFKKESTEGEDKREEMTARRENLLKEKDN